MSTLTMVASQTRFNLIASLRSGASIALGIAMPIAFFVGASALFGTEALGGNNPVEVRGAGEVIDLRTFYVGGFMAYAVIYTAFVTLLPELIEARESGFLKRLLGTPLRLGTFVAAKTLIVVAMCVVSVTLILLIARFAFGVETRAAALVGIAFYLLLGCVMFVSLAFGATSIVRNVSGAQGLSNALGIALALISGVFFAPTLLPEAIFNIASWLPLQPLANGFQALYVTGATGVNIELRDVGVLLGWALLGSAMIVVRGFRWQPRQHR
jgi:ABC-2 type transport system permease protein